MKRVFIGTVCCAALAGGAVFAAPNEHDHGGSAKNATPSCAMGHEHGQRGPNAKGQERMAQMHGRMASIHGARGKDSEHAGHGAQRGNAGQNCPMHDGRKPA